MPRLKTILCPIDFSHITTQFLDFTTEFAVKARLRLALLYVPGNLSIDQIHSKFDEIESRYFTGKSLNYEFAVGKGDYCDEIIRFNRIFKTEFVLIGMPHQPSQLAHAPNMTANWLFQNSTCAVMAIPYDLDIKSIANIALSTPLITRPKHWYVLSHLLRTLKCNITLFHTGADTSEEIIAAHCMELLNLKPHEIVKLDKDRLIPNKDSLITTDPESIDLLVTMQQKDTYPSIKPRFHSLVSINKPILNIPSE